MLTTVNLLAILAGTLIPILNGLLTKQRASRARAVLQLVLNSAAGFLSEWLDAATSGTAYDVRAAALTAVLGLATAVATEMGVWAPLGVSGWAKTNGRRDYDLAA